jgi:hypothetical protein
MHVGDVERLTAHKAAEHYRIRQLLEPKRSRRQPRFSNQTWFAHAGSVSHAMQGGMM